MSARIALAGAALALLFVPGAAGAATTAYLPCSNSAGERALVLVSRPASCLTLSNATTTDDSVRLTSARWTGWGTSVARATAVSRPFGQAAHSARVTVTADRLRTESCGSRRYYSHLTLRAEGRVVGRAWAAPGCDVLHYQRTFRVAVAARLAALPGRVIDVSDSRCALGSPGVWSCTATGDREYHDGSTIHTCIYLARGHFNGERAVLAPLRCRRLV